MALTVEGSLVAAIGVRVLQKGRPILHNMDFNLRPGEIHALVGEHHSGKSALGRLFTGAVDKTAGELWVRGTRVQSLSPKSAAKLGISMLHQSSHLIPGLTVFENLFLGALPRFMVDKEKLLADSRRLLARVGVDVSPQEKVAELSQPERNMVELAAVLANRPGIVILDEVSRRFNPEEMEVVFSIIDELRRDRGGVVFISTSIDEIMEFADRVTILRDGVCRGTEDVHFADKAELLNRTFSYVVSRESLRKSNIELHAYKRYNEQILRNLPIGIVILDPNHAIHLANETARNILQDGLAPAELKSADDLPEQIKSILKTPDLVDELVKFEYEGKVVQATSFPFDDTDGEILGVILLLEDVTQEAMMKEHLIRAEKVKSAAALASSLAHEINNPLCIMKNYIELTLRQVSDPDPLEHLGKVNAELDHIVGIVNDLLPFSRQQESIPRPFDLKAMVDDTIRLMRMNFAGRNIGLEFECLAEQAYVVGNENRMKQVIVNLLMNGVEAGDENRGVRLGVSLSVREDAVRLAVADDGPGIPEEIRSRIFDPFFSSKSNKKNTGLGLSICQHIVESHRGTLRFDRRAGWTLFIVDLPHRATTCTL